MSLPVSVLQAIVRLRARALCVILFVFFPVRPSRALAFDAALFLCTLHSVCCVLPLLLRCFFFCFIFLSFSRSLAPGPFCIRKDLSLPRIHRQRGAERDRAGRGGYRDRESQGMCASSFFQQSAVFILHHPGCPRDTR